MFKYSLIITLFVVNIAQAQQGTVSPDSLKGLVVYQQKINMTSSAINFDTLRFNRTKSVFEWNLYPSSNKGLREAKEKYPNAKVAERTGVVDYKGQVTLLDTEKDSIFSRMPMIFIDKLLYLKEKAPKIDWTIVDSTKMIGNYRVRKATAHFRGRKYTAWFTPEIPVPFGPWKLHGLPGLILQAYDQSGRVYFSAIDIAFIDVGPIGPIPLNGKEQNITLSKYKEIIDNFKRYHKSAVLKKIRPYVSREDLAGMTFDLQEIELMETFDNDAD